MTVHSCKMYRKSSCATALFFICLFPMFAQAALELQEIATGLDRPVFVTHAGDNSGRLFIVEQGGKFACSKTANSSRRLFWILARWSARMDSRVCSVSPFIPSTSVMVCSM